MDEFPPLEDDKTSRLWTIGVSAGTSFLRPMIIATARFTLAPFKYSFLELGYDFGFVSGVSGVGYTSMYPFGHYCLYIPFEGGGWYAGAGVGYMMAKYTFPEPLDENIFALDFITGVNVLDFLDVSFTMRVRPNFSSASPKLSVGYTYRFK